MPVPSVAPTLKLLPLPYLYALQVALSGPDKGVHTSSCSKKSPEASKGTGEGAKSPNSTPCVIGEEGESNLSKLFPCGRAELFGNVKFVFKDCSLEGRRKTGETNWEIMGFFVRQIGEPKLREIKNV